MASGAIVQRTVGGGLQAHAITGCGASRVMAITYISRDDPELRMADVGDP
jgi:hypothetical protein